LEREVFPGLGTITRMVRRHVLQPIQSRSFQSKNSNDDTHPPTWRWYIRKKKHTIF